MKKYSIKTEFDLTKVIDEVTDLASRRGFDKLETAEINLSLSEIGKNTLKYAGKGTVIFEIKKKSLYITVQDRGPGIKETAKDMKRNPNLFKRGLGVGIESARRNMDEFKIKSDKNGTTITMIKYMPIPDEAIEYGVVSLGDENYDVNGDSYVVREYEGDKVLLAVIDGTGEGETANASANIAKKIIENNYKAPLRTIVTKCAKELEKYRTSDNIYGVALCILRLKPNSYEYIGVGDTNTDIITKGTSINLKSQSGILGRFTHRTIKTMRRKCQKKLTIIMRSDGMVSFDPMHSRIPLDDSAQKIANHITNNFRRPYGDATVLVTKRMK